MAKHGARPSVVDLTTSSLGLPESTDHALRTWRGIGIAIFAVSVVATSALIFLRPPTDQLADLKVYLRAIEFMRNGGTLYGFRASNGDPFTYPPFAALLLLPLSYLSEVVVEVLWTGITFLAVLLIARQLVLAASLKTRRLAFTTFGVATLIVVSAPMQSNVRFGQVSALLIAAIFWASQKSEKANSITVGLATAVKLTPGVFLLDMLTTLRIRSFAIALGSFLGASGIAWLWQPAASRTFWRDALFQTSRIGDLSQLSNQSMYGMALRFPGHGVEPRLLWIGGSAIVCALGLFRARQLRRSGKVASAIIVVGLVSVAVSPVSWVHHQLWAVLAALTLVLAPSKLWRVSGVILLAIMTFDTHLSAIAPHLPLWILWPIDNLRGLVVVALCCCGLPLAPRQTLTKPLPSL